MRILVAVTNCWARRQRQEAIRNTWLKDIPPTIDVRFFLGRALGTVPPLKDDEVLVDVDDGYRSLPAKTRAICRYAFAHGYDWLFKSDDDAYVQLQRLERSSGFAGIGSHSRQRFGTAIAL